MYRLNKNMSGLYKWQGRHVASIYHHLTIYLDRKLLDNIIRTKSLFYTKENIHEKILYIE